MIALSDREPIPGFARDTVFRSLFAAYPDGLLVVDLEGWIVLANPAAAELLGYANGELIGLPVDALVPEGIRPRHGEFRHAYSRRPRSRPMGTQMDLVARKRDGSEVMVEIALSPLQEHGLPYVVAAVRGIGAYPRVKQALQRARYSEHVAQFGRFAVDARDSQELLEQAPKVAADALQIEMAAMWMLEGPGLEFRLAAGVGLPRGEKVGTRIANRTDTLAGFALQSGRPVVVDDHAHEPRFAGPHDFADTEMASAAAVPVLDRARPLGVLTVHARAARHFGNDEIQFLDSLSSLLATSLQRAQSEEALKHSQRLESVGQLTGGIAHDFNNLLTVISGNLQVLEDLPSIIADPFAPQLVSAAMRAGKRGAELTGKLLAFSRRQVLQPAVVDVPALLESLSDMLRRTIDQRIVIEMCGTCAPCLADPSQLESALLNIAINARDAMPEGGVLRFTGGPAVTLPAELQGELDANGAYIRIAVSDTGVGMSDAVRERAFEPFYTTKEVGRGTGLGLSTVYGFAKQSQGAATLESVVGMGTTVSLYLPAVSDAMVHRPGIKPVESFPEGMRVLVVEDDAEVRSVTHNFLASMGSRVTECAGAEQALDLLASEPSFALVLTDIALGAGMRGTELAREVQRRWPHLPVLLMSGYSSELAGAHPGHELLRKPYTRAELAQAVARALATGPLE